MNRYLQFFFNLSLILLSLYLLLTFLVTLWTDVDAKITTYSQEIRSEIFACNEAYLANNCEPSKRMPALQALCEGWEQCMNRFVSLDPSVCTTLMLTNGTTEIQRWLAEPELEQRRLRIRSMALWMSYHGRRWYARIFL